MEEGDEECSSVIEILALPSFKEASNVPMTHDLPQDSDFQWRQGVELCVTLVCSGVFGSHNVPTWDDSNLLGLEVAEEEAMVDHLVSAPAL